MQRSITHQNTVELFAYIAIFVLYSSLSSIHLYLPPMLAVLFVLFTRSLAHNDYASILILSFCLVIFEANHGYMLFSSIIYFYIVYKFIMPRINQNFSCRWCIKLSSVLVAYPGYFLFLYLTSSIFLLSSPELNYYIVYYIVIEFLLVSIL
ncbi:MAG: hypothetical protein SPLUMA1_SPLUMAMAG1_01713 [uncultured Sulfurimonas sp.]|nr:MAG: hypothetical protein SPLUMA1_SPLUMAMAG1_01713 [uncultured Sulfurimonas sp.]